MDNDNYRWDLVNEINDLSQEFIEYPNQCAYTDDLVRKILEKCEELKAITPMPKEYFQITCVSREDLIARNFDVTGVTDPMMEMLASEMSDAYCESGVFWTDMEIIAENTLGIHQFCEGEHVKWHDPGINDFAPEERDIQRNRVYEIVELGEGTALIHDDFGEAEVPVTELELVIEEE